MKKYYNSFDLGLFICVGDNNDGTGNFIKEEPLGEEGTSFILPEYRQVKYPWAQMKEVRDR
jgi:hypothetical protein